ncbi:MAG: MBL fold metallo-hydrolase [Arenicella sp.]|jgi:L-ascorbate metabolism protein UlaG (beta-lactamase superfamily)|nr:MBL fold metallo-hydrolase [Arenicella sp.]
MLQFTWRLIKGLMILLLLLVIAITLFIQFAPVFGGKPDAQSMAKLMLSDQFDGEVFRNLMPTDVATPSDQEVSIMDFLNPPAGKIPAEPLPSKQFRKDSLTNGDFVWFGHSTVLMRTNDVTIITDPVFYNASPIPFTVTPFALQVENRISDLPEIDVVLISHDHYDHLDYQAIQEMDPKVKKYLVPLGVKAHLQRWGVADSKIVEMDWYESDLEGVVRFTFAPARHFSGRGLNNRLSTLWGSWVVQSNSSSVYFSGDSGYSEEFKKIGDQFGPFDIAFLEDGAYNPAWDQIHMYPEESVQASIDLNAKVYFPIHWGKFDLSTHTWTDPITRAHQSARQKNVQLATPVIGDVFSADDYPQSNWWSDIQ